MSVKKLISEWALPDRTMDRAQITLRIPYPDYARLHALKEVFPGRSVNEMICDILKAGLDEVVESLNSFTYTKEDYDHDLAMGNPDADPLDIGHTFGQRVKFDMAYKKILEEKPDQETKEAA